MRQSAEDQLVETGADVSILPKWERVLVVCVTEAGKQVCRTKSPHDSAGFTPSIPQKYLPQKNREERVNGGAAGPPGEDTFFIMSELKGKGSIKRAGINLAFLI